MHRIFYASRVGYEIDKSLIHTTRRNNMKNLNSNTGNHFFDESSAAKTSDFNERETKAANRSASKTKRAIFVVNTVLLLFLFLALTGGAAQAATFTVNLTTDAVDANTGDGVCDTNIVSAGQQCTLRAAIQQANATVGVDDIAFSLAGTNTINLTIGELQIIGSLNITGPGARLLTVRRAVNAANFRVFFVQFANAATVNISGITIANGNAGSGAGIENQANLNLTEVAIKDNIASGSGGGIFNGAGTLNIVRSTLSNNTALQGGGINNNSSAGAANIINSTISDNKADDGGTAGLALGGGIYNFGALTIVNSTFSNNTSVEQGGGIHQSGTLNPITMRNTIVAGNAAAYRPDVYGAINSQGNNLIGVAYANNNFTGSDKTGTEAAPLLALLGTLQDNGGQTDTHALVAGSPAINAGNACVAEAPLCVSAALATDQRGQPRKSNGAVDIGAYEEQLAPTAASVSISGRVLQQKGRGLSNAKVVLTSAGGDVRYAVTNAFGHYRFDDVAAGETYVFDVQSKRYVFPTQVLFVAEGHADFNFVPLGAADAKAEAAF
jgi:predicted outer membrane repeat protein